MTMPTYESLEAQIIILRSLLGECQDFLFDDSGTPVAPEGLRERVNEALHAGEPERPKPITRRFVRTDLKVVGPTGVLSQDVIRKEAASRPSAINLKGTGHD